MVLNNPDGVGDDALYIRPPISWPSCLRSFIGRMNSTLQLPEIACRAEFIRPTIIIEDNEITLSCDELCKSHYSLRAWFIALLLLDYWSNEFDKVINLTA